MKPKDSILTNGITCITCFDSHEIFNGKEMIPCPKCTDKSFKEKNYQERKFQILKDIINADKTISEEAEETETDA